jgi:hypothetical protein
MRKELLENIKNLKANINEYFKQGIIKNIEQSQLEHILGSYETMLENGHVKPEIIRNLFDKLKDKINVEPIILSENNELLEDEKIFQKEELNLISKDKMLNNQQLQEKIYEVISDKYQEIVAELGIEIEDEITLEVKLNLLLELELNKDKKNKDDILKIITQSKTRQIREKKTSKKPMFNQLKRFVMSPLQEIKKYQKDKKHESAIHLFECESHRPKGQCFS